MYQLIVIGAEAAPELSRVNRGGNFRRWEQVRGRLVGMRVGNHPRAPRGFQSPLSRGKAEKLASSNLGTRNLGPSFNLRLAVLFSSFSQALPRPCIEQATLARA